MSMNIRGPITTARGPRWEARWSEYDDDGKRHERSKRFNTEHKARSFKHRIETTKHDEPTANTDHNKTISYWADAWLVYREEQVTLGQIRPSSLYSSQMVVRQTVKPYLGHRKVRSMTVDDVDQFISRVQIERGVKPGTAKQHYNVLRQVLAYAVRKGAIRVNPAAGVRRNWSPTNLTTHAPFESVALDRVEVEHLVTHLQERYPDAPWALMVRFMAYTGLRAGEVAGLDIRDIRLLGTVESIRHGEVHVRQIRTRGKGTSASRPSRPKTGKTRTVPIKHAGLRRDLAQYLDNHPNKHKLDAPLWPGTTARYERDPITKAICGVRSEPDYTKVWNRDPFYRRVFRPALTATGLPPMRLHDLRHTAGSIMLSEGYPDWKVAQWLGHSPDILHRIYAHILDSDWDAEPDMDTRPAPRQRGGGTVQHLPLNA